jgi:peptidoglycan hydrolase-like protein with peptidoglycan-binding domain
MTMIPTPPQTDDQDPSSTPVPHSNGAPPEAVSATHETSETPRPKRRLWPWAVAGLAVVGGGAAYALSSSDGEAADDTASETIRAVSAETRDLIEFDDLDGTLGYAQSQLLFATPRSSGASAPATAPVTTAVVTAVAADGATLERGDVVFELNALPTVLFYGDVPFYRDLAEGAEGDDVATLEANLASLGYHLDRESSDADDNGLDEDGNELDTGFVVDGVYDDATVDAVLRWQADLGVDETGDFRLGDAVVATGPVVITNPLVDVGSIAQSGAPMLTINPRGTVQAFYNPEAGEVELQVTSGTVETGQVFLVRDELPVTAIVTSENFERDLSEGDEGADVEIIEQMLVDLGYDARGDLIPDDEFDDITTEAVEDWEEDLQDTWEDVDIDGIISLEELALINPDDYDGPVTVAAVTARETDVTAAGSELFSWTGGDVESRIVTTSIPVADQDKLAEGTTVDIEFPDGSISAGTVSEVASSSTVNPADPNAEPELEVTITVAEIPADATGFSELDVTVKVIENLVSGATVVPASAILSTPEGDYAVEVVDAATGDTSLVVIEPGMFTDGFVEVTGIDPGTAVVVPS